MTEALEAAIDGVISVLDATEDHAERFQATREVDEAMAVRLKEVLQRLALQMRDEGITWRKIGETMGGVSPQRAEQISRGV